MALEFEHPRLAPARPLGVDDRRHLAVRIDGAEGRRVLLALGRIDGHDFVGRAEFLEQQRDLGGIGRGVEIEADHGRSLRVVGRGLSRVGSAAR